MIAKCCCSWTYIFIPEHPGERAAPPGGPTGFVGFILSHWPTLGHIPVPDSVAVNADFLGLGFLTTWLHEDGIRSTWTWSEPGEVVPPKESTGKMVYLFPTPSLPQQVTTDRVAPDCGNAFSNCSTAARSLDSRCQQGHTPPQSSGGPSALPPCCHMVLPLCVSVFLCDTSYQV